MTPAPGAGRARSGSSPGAGFAPLTAPRPPCRWVAYQKVGFSGEQYVLEKGVYRNCDDWGAGNSALASLQPVLQVRASRGGRGPGTRAWSLEGARRCGGETGRRGLGARGRGLWEGAELTRA